MPMIPAEKDRVKELRGKLRSIPEPKLRDTQSRVLYGDDYDFSLDKSQFPLGLQRLNLGDWGAGAQYLALGDDESIISALARCRSTYINNKVKTAQLTGVQREVLLYLVKAEGMPVGLEGSSGWVERYKILELARAEMAGWSERNRLMFSIRVNWTRGITERDVKRCKVLAQKGYLLKCSKLMNTFTLNPEHFPLEPKCS